MAVLICKNIHTEGPGTLEDFLKEKGISYTIVEMSMNNQIPDTKFFDTLVILGGPMSVNDYTDYPYIKTEENLVKEFISQDKRILGICLGSQIIAKALGSKIYKGAESELGWYDIELTSMGIEDPLIKEFALMPYISDICQKFPVFHWHAETFDLPENAIRLASSELYINQAFKYGKKVYGFQFHIEMTKELIEEWLIETPDIATKIQTETDELWEIYHIRAKKFYQAFFNL
ncbi:MAG: hypothetical protein ACD_20C00395G0008 [uncultured bacterium]|nr:MAG: hypothetical protein ACD_20C00395G0008 [uncultured bacterium]